MNAAQHKIYLKYYEIFFVITCGNVFIVWPRQLFFQCDPETPKGWTPLEGLGPKQDYVPQCKF